MVYLGKLKSVYSIGLVLWLPTAVHAQESIAEQRISRPNITFQSIREPVVGLGGQLDVGTATRDPTTSLERRFGGDADQEGDQSQKTDYSIASRLLDENLSAGAIAQMAVERSENASVKALALSMVKDHREAASRLEMFVGINRPTDTRSQFDQHVNRRHTEAIAAELATRSGGKFDAGFLDAQVAGEMRMIACLDVLIEQSTGDLQRIAKENQPRSKAHLATAWDLMRNSHPRP